MNLNEHTKKLVGNDEERAVSPVIGVILMVAITVILAAVIAAFVLDLGQSQSATASAGVDFSQDGSDTVTVTWINDDRTDGTLYVHCDGLDGDWDTPGTGDSLDSVGDSYECSGTAGEVTVMGAYDGSESVITTYEV